MITFWIAERGLETRIAGTLTEAQWAAGSAEHFGPNLQWYAVTVADAAAKATWIRLRNEELCANWTPNQSPAERDWYAEVAGRAEAERRGLEVTGCSV